MLRLAAEWLVYSVLWLSPGALWAETMTFFIYDSLKILILLFVMIAGIGFLRTFLPHEKVKGWLGEKKGWGNFFASLFGAITPFCSCSSIPIFLSFIKAGIPLGITFSFLITSPLINEYLVVIMLGFFGWKIATVYVLSGMFLGILCGIMLGKMKLEIHLVEDMLPAVEPAPIKNVSFGLRSRIAFGLGEAVSIIKKLWLWVLLGVGIGALIHNYVPQEMIQGIIQKTGIFSVPIATLVGVPMYGSCAAIVPIAVVLFQKGVPLGTALAFMMAISALSLPEAVMLRRAMKLPLIAIFFGITATSIILTGYLINALQPFLI
ncbi:MAG: permease [Candidatus Omnitrophota bacterium]